MVVCVVCDGELPSGCLLQRGGGEGREGEVEREGVGGGGSNLWECHDHLPLSLLNHRVFCSKRSKWLLSLSTLYTSIHSLNQMETIALEQKTH